MRPPPRRTGAYALPRKEHAGEASPRLSVSVARAGQVSTELLALSPALLYVPAEEIPALPPLAIPRAYSGPYCPAFTQTQTDPGCCACCKPPQNRGAAGAAVSNLGHLPLCREAGLPMRGDWGLNVTNSETLRFLQRAGLRSAAVSFELRAEQIRDLDKALPTEAVVYGRLPLMLTEHCLNKPRRGACRCTEAPALLTDRTGAAFPCCPPSAAAAKSKTAKPCFWPTKTTGNAWDWLSPGCVLPRSRRRNACACCAVTAAQKKAGSRKNLRGACFYRSVE